MSISLSSTKKYFFTTMTFTTTTTTSSYTHDTLSQKNDEALALEQYKKEMKCVVIITQLLTSQHTFMYSGTDIVFQIRFSIYLNCESILMTFLLDNFTFPLMVVERYHDSILSFKHITIQYHWSWHFRIEMADFLFT